MTKYTKFQQDNVIRLGIEVLKGACERVGHEAIVGGNKAGDIVITIPNPQAGDSE